MSIAVYAGTFDPITAGHFSIVRQAAKIFAHVRVLVSVNPAKKTLLSVPERVELAKTLCALLPNVSVDATEGIVVEYARSIGANFLLRGIRGASDAEFETQLAQTNRDLAPEIATVLLPAEAALSQVSSSELKRRIARGEDIRGFCPAPVERFLRERLSTDREGAQP